MLSVAALSREEDRETGKPLREAGARMESLLPADLSDYAAAGHLRIADR